MLSSLQPLPSNLEAVVQTGKPLLIVAEDIERRRGGGAALLRAKAAVGKLKDENPYIQAGINIALRALEAPSPQIAENAGAEDSVVVGKIPENKSRTHSFDAQTERHVDMRAPASSTRRRSYRSCPGRRVGPGPHTDNQAMVAETPKKKEAPAAPGGGMEGMDY